MVTIENEVLQAFHLHPEKTEQVKEGLINAGFKITTTNGNWFLQKLNTGIFTQPAIVQQNYERISKELNEKGSFKLPSIKKTITGFNYFEYKKEVWRCFEFYDHCYSRSLISAEKDAYTIGNCFGKLTADLKHLPAEKIQVTIPHFHDLSFRYANFLKAVEKAGKETLSQTHHLIEEIQQTTWPLMLYQRMIVESENFHTYIMHHDCKLSNILFSTQTNEVVCPVDMDTTMPGYFFSDLGDMIRSMCNNLDEDDHAIENMVIDIKLAEAFEEGYTQAVHSFFTVEEIKMLPFSGHLLAYMQTLRFLTDYLQGNTYYRIEYPEHNLHRMQNQWRLFSLLQEWRPFPSNNR